jgi:hypothetical protein
MPKTKTHFKKVRVATIKKALEAQVRRDEARSDTALVKGDRCLRQSPKRPD